MIDSAKGVESGDAPLFERQVEFRFSRPVARWHDERGGKVSSIAAPDPERLLRAAQSPLTRAVQVAYGPQTAVLLTLAASGDIRLSGNFGEKTGDTKARLSDLLTQTFEQLEFSED